MVDAEVVRQIRELHRGGWGAKRIARELEVARNTVRRYLRLRTVEAGIQIRPRARQLDAPARAEALRLFDGPAEHNAVVVTQLLRERGVAATERVVQKVVAPRRRELRALQLATVRYETAPGHQMQVDFGQKRVRIGERTVVVHLLVAVLSYSRRIFVKAFLAERGDDWREGPAAGRDAARGPEHHPPGQRHRWPHHPSCGICGEPAPTQARRGDLRLAQDARTDA